MNKHFLACTNQITNDFNIIALANPTLFFITIIQIILVS